MKKVILSAAFLFATGMSAMAANNNFVTANCQFSFGIWMYAGGCASGHGDCIKSSSTGLDGLLQYDLTNKMLSVSIPPTSGVFKQLGDVNEVGQDSPIDVEVTRQLGFGESQVIIEAGRYQVITNDDGTKAITFAYYIQP